MSLNDQYFKKIVLDLVIMNDDLCFHSLTGPHYRKYSSFALPESVIIPPIDEEEMEAFIRCPVCEKIYPEASKRFKKRVVIREKIIDMKSFKEVEETTK